MEKAYDRIEWDFILKCLQELGFHFTWNSWIKQCISSVSYSLIVNDKPHGLFIPTSGIRQGDPLSPYLFIICMEALNNMLLKEAFSPRSGIGVKICPASVKISCLLFADDCLLFCKANLGSCSQLKSILDSFCSSSRQLVNYHKSALTFSRNATDTQKQLVTVIFKIPHRESLGKYLGCPVFQGRPSYSTFQEIINKVTTKLEGWKANYLSEAGRTILIQSHLESLSAHTM